MLKQAAIKHKDFGLYFWLHILLILVFYSSFLWADWVLVLIGVVMLKTYHQLRGGCDISHLEFKDKETMFVVYYLEKIFPQINEKAARIVFLKMVPAILVLFAVLLQIALGYRPLLNI